MTDATDNGDSFHISPDDLDNVAVAFYTASSDTYNLQATLNQDTSQLVSAMSSALDQSTASLNRFFNRWYTAVGNLADALEQVGTNLDNASSGTQQTDNDIKTQFHGF